MLNKNNIRELAYLVKIDKIEPIEGKDRVECAIVNGWTVMVKKGQFQPGDVGIYFEIDSRVPEKEPFMFLSSKNFKIKTQRYKAGNGYFWSQGLLMAPSDFGWVVATTQEDTIWIPEDGDHGYHHINDESKFLTKILNITYSRDEDNVRKSSSDQKSKYKAMAARHSRLFKTKPFRWLMKKEWGKKFLYIFFGNKKEINEKKFPTHFPYIHKTDQERVENMPWVLNDPTPYIVTEKCDGSSATYILERKLFGFEFYVCSRNIRQLTSKQKCFYEDNYYWECAQKYGIEHKMKAFLQAFPKLKYVCWQGEICGPGIQGNPQGLSERHLFCFHMIDSEIGKYDIREAEKIWHEYNMEVVPIIDTCYLLPSQEKFKEFKQSADGYYHPSCCEGKTSQPREGFVYYKTTDPNFSFKNVSRKYLLKHEE